MAGLGTDGAKQWSEPLSMKDAVSRAPVLICLDEGDRGSEEALSFSAGDCMALEGERVSKEGRLVMAHHTSGTDDVDDIYRAVVMLPYDMLPDIDVRMLEDPEGEYYRRYVNTNFPGFSWTSVEEDDCNYTSVRIINPYPRQEPKPAPSDAKPRRRAPPPPPGHTEASKLPPPPVPPKPIFPHANLPVLVAADGGKPPPIPPRAPRGPQPADEFGGVYVIEPDELDKALMNMPTLAELYANNVPRDTMGVPIVPVKKEHEKKKKGPADTAIGKAQKANKQVSEEPPLPSPLPVPTSPGTNIPEYIDIIGEDDDDSDYEVIDEDMMAPCEPDKPESQGGKQGKKSWGKSEQKQKEKAHHEKAKKKTEGKDGRRKSETKQTAEKANKSGKSKAAKPMVRVPPHGVGGVPLMNQSWYKSPSERSPAQVPHPLMKPGGGYLPEFVAEEQAASSPLAGLTCKELCLRLEKCGMSDVANICQQKSLDGQFFLLLSDEDMKKPPFSLADFEVNTKLKMVKAGWVPRT